MIGAEVLARDPVLARFRVALEAMYGDRLQRIVLYGSRARGDHRPDSDYDLAVFLDPLDDRWAEIDRLGLLRFTFMEETERFFEARPHPPGSWANRTPLMHEIRREGIDL